MPSIAKWLKSSCAVFLVLTAPLQASDLTRARDRQDKAWLQENAARLNEIAAAQPANSAAQTSAAHASSILAEVSLELGDKALARTAAETGIAAARRALASEPKSARLHLLLGTLCGQIIPANLLSALKYGQCARDEVEEAIALDPKSGLAYVSRGVGNYYLPESFGGGISLALQDFNKAIELSPKMAEAHLWRGLALRKSGQMKQARLALETAARLNPERLWIRQQLEKTSADQ